MSQWYSNTPKVRWAFFRADRLFCNNTPSKIHLVGAQSPPSCDPLLVLNFSRREKWSSNQLI